MNPETRNTLAAIYGAIEALGGIYAPDEERSGYANGHREALELALMEIDKLLNDDAGPDRAWIAEGWTRFNAAQEGKQA
jgi:hypothetical protein